VRILLLILMRPTRERFADSLLRERLDVSSQSFTAQWDLDELPTCPIGVDLLYSLSQSVDEAALRTALHNYERVFLLILKWKITHSGKLIYRSPE
jgi:hypothetical protein